MRAKRVSILPSLTGSHPGIVSRPLVPRTTRTLALAVGPAAGPAARAFLRLAGARNL
ncbi:hypothetical protein [Mycobacterium syngnathidarum]|uniref:hypothetical protein n=1 Tax=Mycobacterium syngnathidarum TaxID=1908205 RepID=UPI0013F4F07D|nr:hypothetical protein [Mycobacterium syngnathidarum]